MQYIVFISLIDMLIELFGLYYNYLRFILLLPVNRNVSYYIVPSPFTYGVDRAVTDYVHCPDSDLFLSYEFRNFGTLSYTGYKPFAVPLPAPGRPEQCEHLTVSWSLTDTCGTSMRGARDRILLRLHGRCDRHVLNLYGEHLLLYFDVLIVLFVKSVEELGILD
jgi:hypothetical protein